MNSKDRLIEVMKERDLTQQQLADKLRVSRASISHYLTGTRKLTWPIAFSIAYMFRVNPEWLMEGKGNKYLGD